MDLREMFESEFARQRGETALYVSAEPVVITRPITVVSERGRRPGKRPQFLMGAFADRVVSRTGKASDWTLFPNGATYLGMNYLLNTGFRGTSALSSWFCGLINAAAFTSVSINDTTGSHAGWTELTNYDEATRQQWSPGAAATGRLEITDALSVTMDGDREVQGIYLVSISTKGNNTGTLFSTADRGSPRSVLDNETYQFTYAIQATAVS